MGVWFEETWEWVKLRAVLDPLMMVWAAIICVLLTAVRQTLNSVLFKVSGGKGEEREECEREGVRPEEGRDNILEESLAAYHCMHHIHTD